MTYAETNCTHPTYPAAKVETHFCDSAERARALLLNVSVKLVLRVSAALFAPEIDLREWVTFAQADDAHRDDRLGFVSAPLEGSARLAPHRARVRAIRYTLAT